LTSKWSPTSRFGFIEPVGILNAWKTNVRTKSARTTATRIDSKYSRTVDFGPPPLGATESSFAEPGGAPAFFVLLSPFFVAIRIWATG
jgi:hypothetical protein